MSQKVYTEIPDTSDLEYWEPKNVSLKIRTFVPRDKELHRKLKQAAWDKIQASLPYKLRAKIGYSDTTNMHLRAKSI